MTMRDNKGNVKEIRDSGIFCPNLPLTLLLFEWIYYIYSKKTCINFATTDRTELLTCLFIRLLFQFANMIIKLWNIYALQEL